MLQLLLYVNLRAAPGEGRGVDERRGRWGGAGTDLNLEGLVEGTTAVGVAHGGDCEIAYSSGALVMQ